MKKKCKQAFREYINNIQRTIHLTNTLVNFEDTEELDSPLGICENFNGIIKPS